MGAIKQSLLERYMAGGKVRELPAEAGHIVWIREMGIIIDHESGHRDFSGEGVGRVHPKHQVGGVIASPRTSVGEIVLGEAITPPTDRKSTRLNSSHT